MRCRLTKKENGVFVETARLVTWESGDGVVRTSAPKETEYIRPLPFFAGLRLYLHPKQLLLIPTGGRGVYRDGYGKRVFTCRERYPCFDSGDFLNEDRYYHWVYLVSGERLICVYYGDDDRTVTVTKDVGRVPGDHFDAMAAAGLVDGDGYLKI